MTEPAQLPALRVDDGGLYVVDRATGERFDLMAADSWTPERAATFIPLMEEALRKISAANSIARTSVLKYMDENEMAQFVTPVKTYKLEPRPWVMAEWEAEKLLEELRPQVGKLITQEQLGKAVGVEIIPEHPATIPERKVVTFHHARLTDLETAGGKVVKEILAKYRRRSGQPTLK